MILDPNLWSSWMILGGTILVSTVIGYFLVSLILWVTHRFHLFDIPNERSSHSRPTPVGGGLAIALLVLVGWMGWIFATRSPSVQLGCGYAAAAAILALISLCDDLWGLSTLFRLVMHGVAAVVVLALMKPWLFMSEGVVSRHAEAVQIFWGVIAFFWIVGMINAYNFMDGIDGLAGGQAFAAGIGWVLLGQMAFSSGLAWLGALIAGASLGFLLHNRPPAKIFMGDVGAIFLGFTFAFMAVWGAREDSSRTLGMAGVVLLWPFIFDSFFTFSRRLLKGENVFQAHRTHLFQRLVISGWSHGRVSALYSLLNLLGLLIAAVALNRPGLEGRLVLSLVPLMALGLWLLVVYREKHASRRVRTKPSASE